MAVRSRSKKGELKKLTIGGNMNFSRVWLCSIGIAAFFNIAYANNCPSILAVQTAVTNDSGVAGGWGKAASYTESAISKSSKVDKFTRAQLILPTGFPRGKQMVMRCLYNYLKTPNTAPKQLDLVVSYPNGVTLIDESVWDKRGAINRLCEKPNVTECAWNNN